MARSTFWLPLLLRRLHAGLSESPLVSGMEGAKGLTQAREFCLDLWPFISELPENIASVRDILPENMDDARHLLGQLADEESVYQSLYIKQCLMAGITQNDLDNPRTSPTAGLLKDLMKGFCQSGDYHNGMLAIVTAELAATVFARRLTPIYEHYFRNQSSPCCSPQQIEEGLEWLRLHAKQQTGNALLLHRAVRALDRTSGQRLPNTVQVVLEAILTLWRCPNKIALDTDLGAKKDTNQQIRA